MAAVAQLKALLGIDNKQYKAGMRDSESAARRFQASIASVGRALGLAFSVGALISFGRRFVSWASELSIAARNVGLLTSEMIALNRIAIKSGIGVNEMQRLVSRLQSELYNAAGGSKEAAKKFEALGLSVRDLAGMDPAAQLQAVARAALDTGIPLQTLTDLFGERLGPRAMVALREIADEGLPAVSKAMGDTIDQVELFGSRWAETMDVAKQKTAEWGNAVISYIQDIAAFWGGFSAIKGTISERMEEGSAATGRARQEREDALSARQSQREKERKDTAEQMVRIFDETQQKLRDKINAEYSARIAAVEARSSVAVRGRDIRADSMAAVGGMVGASRAGAGVADKMLQKAVEDARRQEEIRKLNQEQADRLAELVDRASGGGV